MAFSIDLCTKLTRKLYHNKINYIERVEMVLISHFFLIDLGINVCSFFSKGSEEYKSYTERN